MRFCAFAMVLAAASSAFGATFNVDLRGRAGPGLLPGNEIHAINGTPGSGGEVGAGITFDDVTKGLTINVGWGSGQGFTNLTGNATVGHIHGITSSPAPAAFNQTAGVTLGLDNLSGWNNSATNGGFVGTVTLNPAQEAALFAGSMYINVHTSANGPGEIRGNLVIPEPATLTVLAALGVGLLRRR
jgi:hypothetical protein